MAAVRTPAAVPTGFGTHVRLWRTARRLTAEQLAARCGVSRSLISQIETERTDPSLDVVRRLAVALEVPMSALFAEAPPLRVAHDAPAASGAPGGAARRRPTVVRRDERKGLRLPRSKVTYELLTPDVQGRLQVSWVELEPGLQAPNHGFVHEGEACYVVLRGRVHLRIGDDEFDLGPGDAVTFDSAVPHGASNNGPDTGVALVCVTPPSF